MIENKNSRRRDGSFFLPKFVGYEELQYTGLHFGAKLYLSTA